MMKLPTHANYAKNFTGVSTGDGPCCVCGQSIQHAQYLVHIHAGGDTIITEQEAATMDPSADLGMQPIGLGCIRQHPDIMDYAQRV